MFFHNIGHIDPCSSFDLKADGGFAPQCLSSLALLGREQNELLNSVKFLKPEAYKEFYLNIALSVSCFCVVKPGGGGDGLALYCIGGGGGGGGGCGVLPLADGGGGGGG